MFDIGFSELMVIALVALVVIGPERLPGVARTVGHLVGRLQRYVADIKADIDREVEFDALRKMRDSFHEAATEVQTTVRDELSKQKQELNEAVGAAAHEPDTEDEAGAAPGESEAGTDPAASEPGAEPAAPEERSSTPGSPSAGSERRPAAETAAEEAATRQPAAAASSASAPEVQAAPVVADPEASASQSR